MRPPLFCLISFRRDLCASTFRALRGHGPEGVCRRVRLANWPENPSIANSDAAIYDRCTVCKLGPHDFGLGGATNHRATGGRGQRPPSEVPSGYEVGWDLCRFPISDECSYAGAHWAGDDTRLNDRLGRLGASVGTLVLAGATFAAIRSSNRSARIAERSLLAGLRLLVVARRDDPPEEVQFADGRVFKAGHGTARSATRATSSTWLAPEECRNRHSLSLRVPARSRARSQGETELDGRATDAATLPRTLRASRCSADPRRAGRTASGRPPYATPAPPYTPPR